MELAHDDRVKYIPIKDVQPGMMVYSLNEELGIIEPHRITTLLDMGVKPVFRLTTEDGRTIRTTGNHPYLVKVKAQGSRINGGGIASEGMLAPKHLSEDYEFSGMQVLWSSLSFIEEDNSEVSYQYTRGNNIKNGIVHCELPFAFHRPQIEDKCQYSSEDIKGQKIHSLFFFDNFIAMIKK